MRIYVVSAFKSGGEDEQIQTFDLRAGAVEEARRMRDAELEERELDEEVEVGSEDFDTHRRKTSHRFDWLNLYNLDVLVNGQALTLCVQGNYRLYVTRTQHFLSPFGAE